MNWLKKIFSPPVKVVPKANVAPVESPETPNEMHSRAMAKMAKLLSGDMNISMSEVIEPLSKAASMGHQPAISELNRIRRNIAKIEDPNFWENETRRAEGGDASACFSLFAGYDQGEYLGNKMEKSAEKARFWLIKSADLGKVSAQHLLGRYLEIEGNQAAGVVYLKKAALQGDKEAYVYLEKIDAKAASDVSKALLDDLNEPFFKSRDSKK